MICNSFYSTKILLSIPMLTEIRVSACVIVCLQASPLTRTARLSFMVQAWKCHLFDVRAGLSRGCRKGEAANTWISHRAAQDSLCHGLLSRQECRRVSGPAAADEQAILPFSSTLDSNIGPNVRRLLGPERSPTVGPGHAFQLPCRASLVCALCLIEGRYPRVAPGQAL